MQVLLPPGWPRPKGYANGVSARGRMIFVAGMIGWDAQGVFHTDDLAGQVRQALRNIVEVLAEGGAEPGHIVRMTWYVTDKQAYIAAYAEIGQAFRELIGSFQHRHDGGGSVGAGGGPCQGGDRGDGGGAGLRRNGGKKQARTQRVEASLAASGALS